MRQLAIALAFVVSAGSAAQAQVGKVTGSAQSVVTLAGQPPVTFLAGPNSTPEVKTIGASGADFNSYVNIGETTVLFESENTVSGPFVRTVSSSVVEIDFTNTTGKNVDFASTITAAGMGFYLADTDTTCLYSDCAQVIDSTYRFQNLRPTGSDAGVLGVVGFDFSISRLGEEGSLYSLTGELALTYGVGRPGFRVVDSLGAIGSVGTPRGVLDDFTRISTGPTNTNIGFSWDATDILFSIGNIEKQTLVYKTTVYSYSNAACLDGNTCLIAYSGFGDPIGRGGGIEEEALRGFGGGLASLSGDGITDIDFEPSQFTIPVFKDGVLTFRLDPTSVPEPSVWLSLVAGFGFIGAALRSRRKPILA